jgi:hypothetical protein
MRTPATTMAEAERAMRAESAPVRISGCDPDGAVTVSGVVSSRVAPAVAAASLSVWAPGATSAGTLSDPVALPWASAVSVPRVRGSEWSVAVIRASAAHPVLVTVTSSPAATVAGETLSGSTVVVVVPPVVVLVDDDVVVEVGEVDELLEDDDDDEDDEDDDEDDEEDDDEVDEVVPEPAPNARSKWTQLIPSAFTVTGTASLIHRSHGWASSHVTLDGPTSPAFHERVPVPTRKSTDAVVLVGDALFAL